MSKGPGISQRRIIAALEQWPAVDLHELSSEDATRSERNSLWRAATVLAEKGRIGMFDVWDAGKGKRIYVLHRPGYDQHEHARKYGLERQSGGGDHGHWLRSAARRCSAVHILRRQHHRLDIAAEAHGTSEAIASSGSPLSDNAASRRSASKNPSCPIASLRRITLALTRFA